MASRFYVFAVISALLLVPAAVRGQRCMGTIHFVIREVDAGGGSTPVVLLLTSSTLYVDSTRSSDGRFQVLARRLSPGKAGQPLNGLTRTFGAGYFDLEYGCTGNYEMLVVRRASGGREKADTMSVRFMNACDETFGIDLPFRPGVYSVLVCDTTRIPVDPATSLMGYVYRPLAEQHPQREYDGFGLSDALVRYGTKDSNAGNEYYFNGQSRFSFHPFANLLCVVVRDTSTATLSAFKSLCDSLGLVEEFGYDTINHPHEQVTSIMVDGDGHEIRRVGIPPVTKYGIHVLRRTGGEAFPRSWSPQVKALRTSPLVAFAGPIVTLNRRAIMAFDNRITLYIDHSADTSEIVRAAGRIGFSAVYRGNVGYIGGLRMIDLIDDAASMYEVNDKALEMKRVKGVVNVGSSLMMLEDPTIHHR